jgi:hypothetical protein
MVGWGEVPAAPPALSQLPEAVANDWRRLYFSDNINFPPGCVYPLGGAL